MTNVGKACASGVLATQYAQATIPKEYFKDA